jgi:hypothetical protein
MIAFKTQFMPFIIIQFFLSNKYITLKKYPKSGILVNQVFIPLLALERLSLHENEGEGLLPLWQRGQRAGADRLSGVHRLGELSHP